MSLQPYLTDGLVLPQQGFQAPAHPRAATEEFVDIHDGQDRPEWACEHCGLFQHADYGTVARHEAGCRPPAAPFGNMYAVQAAPAATHSNGGGIFPMQSWAQQPPPPTAPSDDNLAALPQQALSHYGQATALFARQAHARMPTANLWAQPPALGQQSDVLPEFQGSSGHPALPGQFLARSSPSGNLFVYTPGNQFQMPTLCDLGQSASAPLATPTGLQQCGPVVSQAQHDPLVRTAGTGTYNIGPSAVVGGLTGNTRPAGVQDDGLDFRDWLCRSPLPKSQDRPLTPLVSYLGLGGGEELEPCKTGTHEPAGPTYHGHNLSNLTRFPSPVDIPFAAISDTTLLQSAGMRRSKSSTAGFSRAGKQSAEGARRKSLSTSQMEVVQSPWELPVPVPVKRSRGRPRKNPNDPKWHRQANKTGPPPART